MAFEDIENAFVSTERDRPQMKKDSFPISNQLATYLKKYGRSIHLPILYKDLLRYRYSKALRDANGKLTHWETAIYDLKEMEYLQEGLLKTYAILKYDGDTAFVKNWTIERIDFCEFGNSVPFRIRVFNKLSNISDYYYIKATDASRIYGLELEHLLSPNRMMFLYYEQTLVEAHIPGLPGDVFIKDYLQQSTINKTRLAIAFVQFNERCFVRLLGDMRSYNFVVDITPDVDDTQYNIKAIDFDQQSYEPRKNFYLPQFFKENYEMVALVLQTLSKELIAQYQIEEQTAIAFRVIATRRRLFELISIMKTDELSENYKVPILRNELNKYHNTTVFDKCKTMGEIVSMQLKTMLKTAIYNINKEQGNFID
jgi:hypothetical protein